MRVREMLFLALAWGGCVPAAEALCLAGEDSLFICDIGNRKAALCVSRDIAADRGRMQYRFGRPGAAADFVFPPEPLHPKGLFTREHVAGADWREDLSFRAGDFVYTLFVESSRADGMQAGIVVRKPGESVESLRCRKGSIVQALHPRIERLGLAETTPAPVKPR